MKNASYLITTPHYKFVLNVTERTSPHHTLTFFVGDDERRACLDAHVIFPDIDERLRGTIDPSVASLERIDALEECTYSEVSQKHMDEHSFGKEILYAFILTMLANVNHVKSVKLNDKSFIPCNRAYGDTLDLLTYSIALYGKTWYEDTLGAYITPIEKYNTYREKIAEYMSPTTKSNTSFQDILDFMTIHNNRFAENYMQTNMKKYVEMYNNSETLPDFFKLLNKCVPRKDKCAFFKTWLEEFIKTKIPIHREWRFDLYNNDAIKHVTNTINPVPIRKERKTRKTRKARR